MSALKNVVINGTMEKVRVAYLDRDTAKWWNQRRRADDTAIFCGWYWSRGNEEAGPFRTRSSAIRDAYYRFVLLRDAPMVGMDKAGGFSVPRAPSPRAGRKAREAVATW